MTDRRKSLEERKLEKQIKEELLSQAVDAGISGVQYFGRGLLYFFSNLAFGFVALVFVPDGAAFLIHVLGFGAGFLTLPLLRRISDRL